jgi:hypothetical protein
VAHRFGAPPQETETMTTQTFHQLGGRDCPSRRESAYTLAAALEVLVGNTSAWTVVVRAKDGYVAIESSDDHPSDIAARTRLIGIGITAAAKAMVAASVDDVVRNLAKAGRAVRVSA